MKPTVTNLPSVVFFGNERLSTGLNTITPQVLPALITNGFNVTAVVSNNQSTTKRVAEVEVLAKANNIQVLCPQNPLDILPTLTSLKPDIGVLVAYGRIVPQSIIELFPYGIINIHPSLLPLYRGSTPVEQVILDEPQKTGVSIMGLTKAMDAGPVYVQSEVILDGSEQKSYLAQHLLTIGADMIMALLKDFNNSLNNFSTQENNLATYTPQIIKADGLIDWGKPAERLEREIRAYLGWPGSYTKLAGKDVIITDASVIESQGIPGTFFKQDKQLGVSTSQGALIINRLKPAGKREMTGQEFLAGNSI